MLFKVIGVEHSMGMFQERPFDNYNLYLVYASGRKENEYGLVPVKFMRNNKRLPHLTVKAGQLHQIISSDQVEKLVGKVLSIEFDMYGNASQISIQNS